jgi:LPPG:FO 2-phospho-L-lactate transferase
MTETVVALSGGVGGAKLVLGLSHAMRASDLIVACNTGDDFDHLGLRICPDIDSVLYALANLSDSVRGWGRCDESWVFMEALASMGGPDWFNLGDRDLATHVLRSHMLRSGMSLSEVTRALTQRLGIETTVLPMSNDPVATFVDTTEGAMAFQHYFVKEKCAPQATGFDFRGQEAARVQTDIADALRVEPKAIIIAPSNPFVSVDPILGLPHMRTTLKAAKAPIVAVSPIVGGQALKGPAAKMMQELGRDVSVLGVAQHYQGLIDGLVFDTQDAHLAPRISDFGIQPFVTDTIMTDLNSRIGLAKATLSFCDEVQK